MTMTALRKTTSDLYADWRSAVVAGDLAAERAALRIYTEQARAERKAVRAAARRAIAATLPAIEKRYANTIVSQATGALRRECWGARTVDGRFDIERLDDTGTPWLVTDMTTGEHIALTGTLRKALIAIAKVVAR